MDQIEIFNTKKQTSRVIQGPEGYDVEFQPMKVGENYVMSPNNKTRYAFINGAVTDNNIYLAYSGSLFLDENSYFGKSIYVYDWEGNPIRKLIFKKNILSLTVSDDDKTIFAYDANKGFIVQANIN